MMKTNKIILQLIHIIPNILFILVLALFYKINIWYIYFYAQELTSANNKRIYLGKLGEINQYFPLLTYTLITLICSYFFTHIYKKIFNKNALTVTRYLLVILSAFLLFISLLVTYFNTL